jgi:hypothetical protein
MVSALAASKYSICGGETRCPALSLAAKGMTAGVRRIPHKTVNRHDLQMIAQNADSHLAMQFIS